MVSLPSSSTEWCNAGASTNLDHYRDWLRRTIEYLDSTFSQSAAVIKEEKPEVEAVPQEAAGEADVDADDNNSCSSNPCGEHALCWNGDGNSYLCTCEPDHPHGNPYLAGGCGRCQYDNHCRGGEVCSDQECVQVRRVRMVVMMMMMMMMMVRMVMIIMLLLLLMMMILRLLLRIQKKQA